MCIEEITSGSSLTGLEPSAVATVIAVIPIADGAVRVIYQTPDGTLKERLLGRADEENIAVATTERPWSFDGDGVAFKLTIEAKRIDLAFLFDQMARNEELQEKLCAAGWDLVVFDEAHKLSAHFSGSKMQKTGRFKLAEKLGAQTRHLLLMTATPHNGKEADFKLFLSLLDSDQLDGQRKSSVGFALTSLQRRIASSPESRHIEVKRRVKGASTVTITRNEMLYTLNQAEKFVRAIVQVDENEQIDGPYYLRNPFDVEPGWGVSSVNYNIQDLLALAGGNQ